MSVSCSWAELPVIPDKRTDDLLFVLIVYVRGCVSMLGDVIRRTWSWCLVLNAHISLPPFFQMHLSPHVQSFLVHDLFAVIRGLLLVFSEFVVMICL